MLTVLYVDFPDLSFLWYCCFFYTSKVLLYTVYWLWLVPDVLTYSFIVLLVTSKLFSIIVILDFLWTLSLFRSILLRLSTSKNHYDLLFMSRCDLLQLLIDFLVILMNIPLPVKLKKIHLCKMRLLQFLKLSLMSHFHLIHLQIFHKFSHCFDLALEPLCLYILAFWLALFLPCDHLLSVCIM